MEENQFYSKVCVTESIKFAVEPPTKEDRNLKDSEKFSCFLTTILARDREVVAVNVTTTLIKCKVTIAKNGPWSPNDKDYIEKVKTTLINVSKDAPISSDQVYERQDVNELYIATMKYCSSKLRYRLVKLRNDITNGEDKIYIKSFLKYAQKEGILMDDIFDNKKRPAISSICNEYYSVAKNDSSAPEKFLRHIKKVGSYVAHLTEIINCACKGKYKNLFSSIELNLLDPPCEEMQPITSWKNIVMQYISDNDYEDFKNKCLKHDEIRGRLKNIYGGVGKELESENSSRLYLHAELNVLTNIIGNKGIKFLAVSKKCCYLCGLYIKYVQLKGHRIVISKSHNKLYHSWKLPNVYKKDFIQHAKFHLDGIIECEITHLTKDYKKVRFVRMIELSDEES